MEHACLPLQEQVEVDISFARIMVEFTDTFLNDFNRSSTMHNLRF
jgi:hypothetical protein